MTPGGNHGRGRGRGCRPSCTERGADATPPTGTSTASSRLEILRDDAVDEVERHVMRHLRRKIARGAAALHPVGRAGLAGARTAADEPLVTHALARAGAGVAREQTLRLVPLMAGQPRGATVGAGDDRKQVQLRGGLRKTSQIRRLHHQHDRDIETRCRTQPAGTLAKGTTANPRCRTNSRIWRCWARRTTTHTWPPSTPAAVAVGQAEAGSSFATCGVDGIGRELGAPPQSRMPPGRRRWPRWRMLISRRRWRWCRSSRVLVGPGTDVARQRAAARRAWCVHAHAATRVSQDALAGESSADAGLADAAGAGGVEPRHRVPAGSFSPAARRRGLWREESCWPTPRTSVAGATGVELAWQDVAATGRPRRFRRRAPGQRQRRPWTRSSSACGGSRFPGRSSRASARPTFAVPGPSTPTPERSKAHAEQPVGCRYSVQRLLQTGPSPSRGPRHGAAVED